jgi:hypothetical protein
MSDHSGSLQNRPINVHKEHFFDDPKQSTNTASAFLLEMLSKFQFQKIDFNLTS